MDINQIIQSNRLQGQTNQQSDILGKDDFLQIMMLQLRHQDPLNPLDNQQMTAQMAQFSELEQMTNLNESFASSQAVNAFTNATHLIGKEIYVRDPNSSPDNPGLVASRVKSVAYSENGPQLTLENGMAAGIADILQVTDPTIQQATQ